VSIVFDYEVDDMAIGVRSPAGANDFSSSLCVQTGYGAHPASYPLPGAKRSRGVTLTTHLHLVPLSRMSKSYPPLPQTPTLCVAGQLCFLCYGLLRIIWRVYNGRISSRQTQPHSIAKIKGSGDKM
jgi:hypothetical protein